jgi:uncharacterized RDD family membrane protein YckC
MNRQKQFIGFFGFLLSVCGLFVTMAPAFSENLSRKSDFFKVLLCLFESSHLGLFEAELWGYQNSDMNYPVNYFNIIFFSIMLLGSALFITRGFKESRLIGFCFAVYFLTSLVQLLYSSIIPIFFFKDIDWKWLILILSSSIFWAWLSFRFTRVIINHALPETIKYETDGRITKSYLLATRWQRFQHFIIDYFIVVLVFTPYLSYYAFFSRNEYFNYLKEESHWAIKGIIVLFLLLYYLVSESVFCLSPGKFFTNTAVIREDGTKAGFKTVLLRTLARLVPFEPLSLLGGEAWHDRWTRTWVIKKENKGIKNGWYILLIPLAVLFAWAAYGSMDGYHDHKEFIKDKKRYDLKMDGIRDELNHLAAGNYIELISDNYHFSNHFIRIERITGNDIIATKLFFSYDAHINNIQKADIWYNSNTGKHDTAIIPRATLQKLTELEYDDDYYKKRGIDLFHDGEKYSIEAIYDLTAPALRRSAQGGMMRYNENRNSEKDKEEDSYSLSLFLDNYSAAADITVVETIEGKSKWKYSMQDRSGYTNQPVTFTLSTSRYEMGAPYQLRLVLQDYNNRKYVYLIKGTDIDFSIRRQF